MAKSGRRVRIFSALEVANICGVVNQTAINWIRNGHLKAFTTPGGQYRIYAKDLAAFLDKRGMGDSGEVLHVMMENADWNTFLIAAEQSVNDTLSAGIGKLLPDHTIIRAFDWFEIGRKLTEDKPGFMILDTDLAGVDIPKFIRTVKSDLFFGRPYVFLLTNAANIGSGAADSNIKAAGSELIDAVFAKPLDLGKLEAVMKNLERHLDTAIIA